MQQSLELISYLYTNDYASIINLKMNFAAAGDFQPAKKNNKSKMVAVLEEIVA